MRRSSLTPPMPYKKPGGRENSADGRRAQAAQLARSAWPWG